MLVELIVQLQRCDLFFEGFDLVAHIVEFSRNSVNHTRQATAHDSKPILAPHFRGILEINPGLAQVRTIWHDSSPFHVVQKKTDQKVIVTIVLRS
jgi:hypothetical protein